MVGLGMNFQEETKSESLMQARLEQCPVCGDRMIKGKYICRICERRDNSITSTPPHMASEPEYKSGYGGCKRCGPFRENECHRRMYEGLWLLCEIPDALDYLVIGKLEVNDLKEYISGKTTSRWNNKDGGIFDA